MSTLIQNLDVRVETSESNSLTWLHISDTHFGHGNTNYKIDQKMICREIINDAKKLTTKIGKPNLILFSGDVAFGANLELEYKEANAWIEELISSVGLTKQDLFIVPGNHDIDRKIAKNGLIPKTLTLCIARKSRTVRRTPSKD